MFLFQDPREKKGYRGSIVPKKREKKEEGRRGAL
jgi:hypothetical protein